jgi:hypothetical protein
MKGEQEISKPPPQKLKAPGGLFPYLLREAQIDLSLKDSYRGSKIGLALKKLYDDQQY